MCDGLESKQLISICFIYDMELGDQEVFTIFEKSSVLLTEVPVHDHMHKAVGMVKTGGGGNI